MKLLIKKTMYNIDIHWGDGDDFTAKIDSGKKKLEYYWNLRDVKFIDEMILIIGKNLSESLPARDTLELSVAIAGEFMKGYLRNEGGVCE